MYAAESKEIILDYLGVETRDRTQMLEYLRSITHVSLWCCKKYRVAILMSRRFTCFDDKGRNLIRSSVRNRFSE